ncbi:hypothetical protein GCM10010166_45580 [Couchioplanes caeruleus subsp. azureus]|nr:hypothetical protein GCM10010166_45580 [Couchioplanes caeruleus subsp. azureus]
MHRKGPNGLIMVDCNPWLRHRAYTGKRPKMDRPHETAADPSPDPPLSMELRLCQSSDLALRIPAEMRSMTVES